jgi:hypothetical protein
MCLFSLFLRGMAERLHPIAFKFTPNGRGTEQARGVAMVDFWSHLHHAWNDIKGPPFEEPRLNLEMTQEGDVWYLKGEATARAISHFERVTNTMPQRANKIGGFGGSTNTKEKEQQNNLFSDVTIQYPGRISIEERFEAMEEKYEKRFTAIEAQLAAANTQIALLTTQLTATNVLLATLITRLEHKLL